MQLVRIPPASDGHQLSGEGEVRCPPLTQWMTSPGTDNEGRRVIGDDIGTGRVQKKDWLNHQLTCVNVCKHASMRVQSYIPIAVEHTKLPLTYPLILGV